MKRWRWWHGVALYAAVVGVQAALRAALGPEDTAFYRRQRLPKFAPPPIAFPIAWGINSVGALYGLLHVANLPPQTPGRAAYLRAQGTAWVLFATFNAAYFGLRSPINAAIVTTLFTVTTATSLREAARMRDAKAALALVPTAAWLALANPLAIAQAARNHDEFWKMGPFLA